MQRSRMSVNGTQRTLSRITVSRFGVGVVGPTPSTPFDALPFAAINGTILSVLVAGVLIWVSMQWTAVRDFERTAFINAARAMAPMANTVGVTVGEERRGYASDTEAERAELVTRFSDVVVMGSTGMSDGDRGREALVILSVLLNVPPLARVRWNSLDELALWAEEARAHPLLTTWMWTIDMSQLRRLVVAYGTTQAGAVGVAVMNTVLVSAEEKMSRLTAALVEVGFALDQRKAQLSRLPAKPYLVAWTMVIAAMFSVGVIVPLFDRDAPVWLVGYVPAIFYAVVLLVCVGAVAALPTTSKQRGANKGA